MVNLPEDRPGSEYDGWKPPGWQPDDEEPAAPETTDGDDKAADSPPASGQEQSPEELDTSEGGGATAPTTPATDDESGDLKDAGFWSEGGQSVKEQWKIAGLFTKKRALISGGALGGVMATFGIFSILQGPFQLVQFSQFLQRFHLSRVEDLSDNSLGKLYKHFSTADLSRQDKRLGRKMAAVAAHYDAKVAPSGLKAAYNDAGKFLGVEVIDPDGEGARRMRELGFELQEVDGRQMFPPQESRRFLNGARRNVIGAMFHAADVNGVTGAIGARVEIKRANASFKWFGNIRRKTNEAQDALNQRIRDANDERVRNGQAPGSPRVTGEPDPNDPPGDEGSPPPVNDATGTGSDELNDAAEEVADLPISEREQALQQSLRRRLANRTAGAAALAVAMVCIADAIGDNFDENHFEKVIKPGLRVASLAVSGGDQPRAPVDKGEIFAEMAVASEHYYNEIDETSWRGAKSVQAEMGEEQTGQDLPDYAKPVQEQNGVLEWISNNFAIEAVCDVAGNAVFGWGLTIFSVLTGGTTVLGLGGEIISDTFLVPILVGYVANWFTNQGISTAVAGAAFGNVANVYTRVMANDIALSKGGVDQGEDGDGAWLQQRRENERLELATMSFSERFLDRNNPVSLTAKMYQLPTPNITATLQSLTKFPANLASLFSSPFKKVSAQTNVPYDYGFNLQGFTEAELNDPRFEDPYVSEDVLNGILLAAHTGEQACAVARRAIGLLPYDGSDEDCERGFSSITELNTGDSDFTPADGDKNSDKGSDFKANGNQCFGINVEADGTITQLDAVKFYDLPSECKDWAKTNNIWQYYRFLILFLSTERDAACYAKDSAACTQVGMKASQTSSQNQGATNGNVYIIGDSITVGMRDTGELVQQLEEAGWSVLGVNAVNSQTVPGAVSSLSPDEAKIRTAGSIIVSLGTNPLDGESQAVFEGQIQSMVDRLKQLNPSAQIKWVNAYGLGHEYNGVNQALTNKASSLGYGVIDWKAEAKANPASYPFTDTIHHTAAGYESKAGFIVSSLGQAP